jgi:hypothetical protein
MQSDKVTAPPFCFQSVSEGFVEDVIKSVPNKYIAGLDSVPYPVIKFVSTEIAPPLTHCINSSLEECSFPKVLKIASTFPLHKGGSKESFNNYRIIAKTICICKDFRIMH